MKQSIFILLLASCAAPQGQTVQWVRLAPEKVDEICRGLSKQALVYNRFGACSKKENGVCTIYASDFKAYDTELEARLGHELKHCFDGTWHPTTYR